MGFSMIATWKMALCGVEKAYAPLMQGEALAQCISTAVRAVEDDAAFMSVGYGARPNRAGEVQFDACYMDGDSLMYGGVIAASYIKNPIDVAVALSARKVNCLLSGEGAQAYATQHGFALRNPLTPQAQACWQERKLAGDGAQSAYDGHDTVCVIAGRDGHVGVGVSTSGLFMKEPGRVGDSPIVGAGLYCDSAVGAAAATGLGEDVVRGCLSYEIVRRMQEGVPVQRACDEALDRHVASLRQRGHQAREISVVAMDAQGNCAASTVLDVFAFAVATDAAPPALWLAVREGAAVRTFRADAAALAAYAQD